MNKTTRKIISFSIIFIMIIPILILSGCFENKKTYFISVSSENNNYGLTAGQSYYDKDQSVYIVAYPKEGYEFYKWKDGNTQNPRNILVNDNASYTAMFKKKEKYAVLDSAIISIKEYSSLTDNEYDNMKKVDIIKIKSFYMQDLSSSKYYFKNNNNDKGYLLDRTTLSGWDVSSVSVERYSNSNGTYENTSKLKLNQNLFSNFCFDCNIQYHLISNNTDYTGNIYTPLVQNASIILTEDKNVVKFVIANNQYFDIYLTLNYHIEY